MNKDRQEQIAARAYQLWEEEGRPHGAHERHWEQASLEVDTAGAAMPKARARARPAAAPRKTPGKAAGPALAVEVSRAKASAAPPRAAAAKVEGGAGDTLSKPAGKPRKR